MSDSIQGLAQEYRDDVLDVQSIRDWLRDEHPDSNDYEVAEEVRTAIGQLNTEWKPMPPQYKDVVVLVRAIGPKSTGMWMAAGDKGTGLCCWDSTGDCWVIYWMERGIEEQWGDPDHPDGHFGPFPDNYRWATPPEGP